MPPFKRHHRASSAPSWNSPSAPPSSAATIAATTATSRSQYASQQLPAAAAAAALRAHVSPPTSVADLRTKRIERRASGSSSHRSHSPHSPTRPGSMSERTLRRSPSPQAPSSSVPPSPTYTYTYTPSGVTKVEVPPVPSIPRDIQLGNSGSRRATNLEPKPRPQERGRPSTADGKGRGASLDRGLDGGRPRTSAGLGAGARTLPRVEELRGTESPKSINFSRPISPQTSPPSKVAPASSGWFTGPMIAEEGEKIIRQARLSKESSKKETKVKPIHEDQKKTQSKQDRATKQDTSDWQSEGKKIAAVMKSMDRPKKETQRSVGTPSTIPQPRPAAEEAPRGRLAEVPAGKQKTQPPMVSVSTQTAEDNTVGGPKDKGPANAPAPQSEAHTTASGNQKGTQTAVTPKPVRSTSRKSAHFLDRKESTESVHHEPPPRSLSPAKSALKNPNSDRGFDSDNDLRREISRRKSARVSFDEGALEKKGLLFSKHVDPEPPHWQQEENLEDIMTPRPSLPSFGSIRNKRNDNWPIPTSHPASYGHSSDRGIGNVISGQKANSKYSPVKQGKLPVAVDPNMPLPPEVTTVDSFPSSSDEESEGDVLPQELTHIITTIPPQSAEELRIRAAPPVETEPEPIMATSKPVVHVSAPSPTREPKKNVEVPGAFPDSSDEEDVELESEGFLSRNRSRLSQADSDASSSIYVDASEMLDEPEVGEAGPSTTIPQKSYEESPKALELKEQVKDSHPSDTNRPSSPVHINGIHTTAPPSKQPEKSPQATPKPTGFMKTMRLGLPSVDSSRWAPSSPQPSQPSPTQRRTTLRTAHEAPPIRDQIVRQSSPPPKHRGRDLRHPFHTKHQPHTPTVSSTRTPAPERSSSADSSSSFRRSRPAAPDPMAQGRWTMKSSMRASSLGGALDDRRRAVREGSVFSDQGLRIRSPATDSFTSGPRKPRAGPRSFSFTLHGSSPQSPLVPSKAKRTGKSPSRWSRLLHPGGGDKGKEKPPPVPVRKGGRFGGRPNRAEDSSDDDDDGALGVHNAAFQSRYAEDSDDEAELQGLDLGAEIGDPFVHLAPVRGIPKARKENGSDGESTQLPDEESEWSDTGDLPPLPVVKEGKGRKVLGLDLGAGKQQVEPQRPRINGEKGRKILGLDGKGETDGERNGVGSKIGQGPVSEASINAPRKGDKARDEKKQPAKQVKEKKRWRHSLPAFGSRERKSSVPPPELAPAPKITPTTTSTPLDVDKKATPSTEETRPRTSGSSFGGSETVSPRARLQRRPRSQGAGAVLEGGGDAGKNAWRRFLGNSGKGEGAEPTGLDGVENGANEESKEPDVPAGAVGPAVTKDSAETAHGHKNDTARLSGDEPETQPQQQQAAKERPNGHGPEPVESPVSMAPQPKPDQRLAPSSPRVPPSEHLAAAVVVNGHGHGNGNGDGASKPALQHADRVAEARGGNAGEADGGAGDGDAARDGKKSKSKKKHFSALRKKLFRAS